jgi:hypothetical protein
VHVSPGKKFNLLGHLHQVWLIGLVRHRIDPRF